MGGIQLEMMVYVMAGRTFERFRVVQSGLRSISLGRTEEQSWLEMQQGRRNAR